MYNLNSVFAAAAVTGHSNFFFDFTTFCYEFYDVCD